ncbi:probable 1-acylglycerol-3-phosphate O-acyltransferase Pnpla3 [Coccomyxa sp. Obi]|nr:probable 1-acylglycerol-3-phosphate O-acyltransferase Pnpla3 [Coccomyxa sp. Obi]
MSVLAQPTCDRKLLVSCSAQHQLRDFTPFTDVSAFRPVTAYSRGSSGSRGRRHQLVHCRATKQDVATKRRLQEQQEQATDVSTAESTIKVPILSGGGGGIFFWWEIGAVKYLQQRFDIHKWQMRGASAGALVATLAACNVDSEVAFECAHRLSMEHKLFERSLGLAGVWGSIVRQWLDELLPANAADMCRGRLKLVVTNVRTFQLEYVDDFATKEELIDANMASAHIPFFLDGRPFASYRGKLYIDGSVTDFLFYDNSELLKCNGDAFILDYTQDKLMQTTRLDFVKLRNPEEIEQLIAAGYAYAQRMDEAGVLLQYFGGEGSLQSPNTGLRL